MSYDELKILIENEITKLEKDTLQIKEEQKELEALQERFDKASHEYSEAYDLLYGKTIDIKTNLDKLPYFKA